MWQLNCKFRYIQNLKFKANSLFIKSNEFKPSMTLYITIHYYNNHLLHEKKSPEEEEKSCEDVEKCYEDEIIVNSYASDDLDKSYCDLQEIQSSKYKINKKIIFEKKVKPDRNFDLNKILIDEDGEEDCGIKETLSITGKKTKVKKKMDISKKNRMIVELKIQKILEEYF